MNITGRVEKTDRQLRMYAHHLSRAIENFSVARLPMVRQTFVGWYASTDRLEKILRMRKKPLPASCTRCPRREESQSRAAQRELSRYRLTFCPDPLVSKDRGPLLNVIQASARRHAVTTVSQKQSQTNAGGSSPMDGAGTLRKLSTKKAPAERRRPGKS